MQKLVAKAEVDVVPIVRSEAAKKALVDKIGVRLGKVLSDVAYEAKRKQLRDLQMQQRLEIDFQIN